MNDLISREKAIDLINKDKIDLSNPAVAKVFKATGNYENAETQVMTCDRHIRFLKELPAEQSESEDVAFWKNRAKKYEDMAYSLTEKIARGIKIDSVVFTKEGIVFKTKPPEQEGASRKGQWITMSDADGVYYACSECGEHLPRFSCFNPEVDLFPRLESVDKTNYCPFCEARMEEEDGSGKDL